MLMSPSCNVWNYTYSTLLASSLIGNSPLVNRGAWLQWKKRYQNLLSFLCTNIFFYTRELPTASQMIINASCEDKRTNSDAMAMVESLEWSRDIYVACYWYRWRETSIDYCYPIFSESLIAYRYMKAQTWN